jgi:hypothetical protein
MQLKAQGGIMRVRIGIALIAATTVLCFASGPAGTMQPLAITISTDKAEVKAGSDVWIKVHLTNTSSREIDLSANINDMIRVDPNYVFDVRDASGNPVPKKVHKHPELATGHAVFRSLKPGESVTDEQDISGLDDLSQPGQYAIQVSRRTSDKEKDGLVKSNTITITVTP